MVTSGQVQTDFSDECYQRVVSFTCDGGKVVTGGSDGVIRVWEVSIMRGGRCTCIKYTPLVMIPEIETL